MFMSIAIIGAGIAGLTAAHTLSSDDVTLFEKSRGLTGRAATRWYERAGRRIYVDHGAQYAMTEGLTLHDLMLSELPRYELVDVRRPVWTFDYQNRIAEGDPVRNTSSKWTYRRGLASLGRLIQEKSSLTIKRQAHIKCIRRETSGRYTIVDT